MKSIVSGLAVMSVDIGSEWMKVAIVSVSLYKKNPFVPYLIAYLKVFMNVLYYSLVYLWKLF